MAKRKQEHWAFEALRKRLAEKTQIIEPPLEEQEEGEPRTLRIIKPVDWEYGTVFLFNPDLREQLDDAFYHILYPLILNEFEGQPFSIPDLEKINLFDHKANIEAARKVVFLMTDPERPVGKPERPWWYIRFNLETRVENYMLSTELLLSLPFSIEPDWVLDYLIDSGSQGISTSLSTDYDEFVLKSSWGEGRSYLLPEEEWINHLTEPFRKHIQIAKAVDRFAQQPKNRFLRSRMLQLITEMYRSY